MGFKYIRQKMVAWVGLENVGNKQIFMFGR